MLILHINTAGHLNTLAITENKQCLVEENWESQRNETETILPKLEGLLKQAELKIEEIEAINIIQGVGGFTSLRVGISIANTIAYDLQIPIYGTSVFELWKERVALRQASFTILIDAGRQEYFYFSIPFEGRNIDFYSPQIVPNSELPNLQEKFWIGEINDKQKQLFPNVETRLIASLRSPGEAFASIDLTNKKPYQMLEPWYGREPNISKAKKKIF